LANVDTDTGKKRGINADINMIPFIDLLMVTVAFLLITAVWVTNSRISTNAELGGDVHGTVVLQPVEKVLHVTVQPDSFKLTWRQGAVVVSEVDVERGPGHDLTALKAKIAEEWAVHGSHKDPHDGKLDQAVLHTDDRPADADREPRGGRRRLQHDVLRAMSAPQSARVSWRSTRPASKI
jgi:hypothetical protein